MSARGADDAARDAERWDLVLEPKVRWWDLDLRGVWRYRDLLMLFVRRDFVAVYKQTILGPLWFFIQPLLTTLVFTVIFSGIARIPTDGFPPVLFYLAGTIPWNYFAACVQKTSATFTGNAGLFGKVYFPRLITPLSVVVSNLVQFGIQFLLFLAMWAWFVGRGVRLDPAWALMPLVLPWILLVLAGLGLGAGIVVSSLTTKYRDLSFLVVFGIQLAMYATPIIYPLSEVPERFRGWLELNPMAAPIEAFRALFLGGEVPWGALAQSSGVTVLLLAAGVLLFNRVEKTFMDTV